ncbi:MULTISPECIES: hypothetical protein [unclassified Streptomyces]|uniref:hypothetical protein n=1 Tax=unclassified Streptomyces TaxID=2593676 RepID=UPI00068CC063|nr:MULTISPECIES: hypothetical protein [unclassified Streptomyces]
MTADAFRILHYGDELTVAHVDGLVDFLTTQTEEAVAASEEGTDSRRCAEALQTLVRDLAVSARHSIERRDAALARGLDTDWTLYSRQGVRREWNRLVAIADRWRGTTDAHRYAPWTQIEHHNAESEAEDAAACAAEAEGYRQGGDGPAAEPVIHADRLTLDHLDALHGFLKTHTSQLLEVHHTGTEEHRAALALETAVDTARDEIHMSLTQDTGLDRDLKERRDAWNRLRGFAGPWRADPAFAPARWPRIKHVPLRAAEEGLPAQDRVGER